MLFTAGEVVYSLYYAGFLYLILSFPAGRLQGKLDRALMGMAIALVTVGQVAWLFFADSGLVCRTCPANPLEVTHDDGIARLLYSLRQLVGLLIALAAIGLLAGRWRRASRPQRRAVMPVVVAGAAALPVTVEAPGLGRYPQKIEAAVYFCVLEALQNAAKYARASAARVALRPDGEWLAFTVEDDGQGFDPATTPGGTGLQGVADRLGALGGTADVTSAPGHGTRVTGRVPGTELA